MKVLLLSLAARGHAIADALSRSSHKPEIYSLFPKDNPGIKKLAVEQHVCDILNIDTVLQHAKRIEPDFAFVAPDDAIDAGMTDALAEIGIPSVSPTKICAQVETSKSFTRDLCEKHQLGCSPKYRTFMNEDVGQIDSYIRNDLQEEYVVKYDALYGGKGVKVSGDHLETVDDGIAYAEECIQECGRVVIEEKLIGVEFSLISFVSGTQVVHMPAVQDHKRAFEGDTGPNTGGMGTYSDASHSLPFLTEAELNQAKDLNQRMAEIIQEEAGEPYKGILFGGFIATANGVKLIEYNARFGDPEALNILPLLESDFVDICQGIINGELTEDLVRFASKATVCKYITPDCYPVSKSRKGEEVHFPAMPDNARIYFGDIEEDENGILHLGGSRTAGIVGIGDTIAEAQQVAQSLCEQVEGPVRFRDDIGSEQLLQERIDMMHSLRG